MSVIFVLSSLSDLPSPPRGFSDFQAHLVVFGVLGVLLVRALAGARWHAVTARNVGGAVALAVLYGISDEYHQSFVAGRFTEVRDLVADGIGAGLGAGLVWAWSIVSSRRESTDAK